MAANKLSTLTILLWNANGISNNTNELQIALKENNVDIALITESHLTSNSKFKIYGYDCLQANHPEDSAHAGAALLISSKIPHSFSSEIYSKHATSRYICKYKFHTYFNNICLLPPQLPIPCRKFSPISSFT